MPYQVFNPAIAVAAPVTTFGAPLTSVGETLATILTETKLEMAGRVDADDTRYTKWINWGYRHVCSIITLKELLGSVSIVITAAKDFYLLPVQVAVAKRMSIIDTTNYATGGREMEKIDENAYRELPSSALITAFAEPTKWFRWQRMLVVWPTPSVARVAALDFKVRPDNLVQTTDSPLLPVEFHESIVLASKYRAERSLRMKVAADSTYNDMLTMLRPIINTDAEETPQQRNHVYGPSVLRHAYGHSRRRDWNWGI